MRRFENYIADSDTSVSYPTSSNLPGWPYQVDEIQATLVNGEIPAKISKNWQILKLKVLK